MLALLLPLTSALVRFSHAPLLSSLSKVCASAHETHAATFVAFNGARMGSCTLEAVALSEEGVQMRSGATLRPLLKALIVQSQARHQGVGTLRVDDAAALAAKWGYKELFCYVNLTNEAARALYRRCSFAPERDAPAENFVRWLSGGQMLFIPRDLQAGQPHQSAATRPRRRLGLATMRLPVAISEALPWDESAYAAVEVEALWEAVLKAYGSEDAAAKAVRQVRGQIVCPIFATPALVAASRAALVERMGEEEAKTIMGKHPCVLTCGDGLLTADPDEIRRFAELRRVLDAIPPQALLGTVAAIGAAVLGKIILIKTGNSDPMG
eukprot:jgi/Chrpa1/11105/Chrysochromulina_OHIO_Genome00020691-RA